MSFYLQIIDDGKGHKRARTDIECPKKKINVYDYEKTCKFDRYENQSGAKNVFRKQGAPSSEPAGKITCEYTPFLDLDLNEQYLMVHHEFASLAGLEPPSGPQSNYYLTNQLGLKDAVEKVIVIRPLGEAFEAQQLKSYDGDYTLEAPPPTSDSVADTGYKSGETAVRVSAIDRSELFVTFLGYWNDLKGLSFLYECNLETLVCHRSYYTNVPRVEDEQSDVKLRPNGQIDIISVFDQNRFSLTKRPLNSDEQ
jgi:hypothetical protein